MDGDWLYGVSQWVIYPVSVAAIVAATELGRRLGERLRPRSGAVVESQIVTLQTALLGLLALMIGFTFSMALVRDEARKDILVQEANAIGTALLRAELLPDPLGGEATRLLRDYVDLRIELGEQLAAPAALARIAERSVAVQDAVWAQARAALGQDPRSKAAALFVEAVNAMIDQHGRRMVALLNHVPAPVFLLLYGIAAVGLGFTGYACGLIGARNVVPNAVMALSIATVVALISDLDRPRRGLITVSAQPLIDLRTRLAAGSRPGAAAPARSTGPASALPPDR